MKQPIPNPALRAISATLALLQVLGSTPLLGSQTPVTSSQSEGSAVALAADQPAPEQPRAVSLTSKPAPLSFSPQPTDAEFFSASLFAVPLCAIGRASPAENRAPADSLLAYSARTDSEDNSTLTQFLDHFPQSPWKPALLVNLGIAWRQTGYFSRAMEAWAEAWELSKRASGLGGRALADRAFGELVQINACVGRYEKLEPLLAEVRDRPLTGGATEMLAGAREGLWIMNNKPERAFMCGPGAIKQILTDTDPHASLAKLVDAKSTRKGFSLTQVRDLASDCGLNYQMARRPISSPIPLRSIIHWKLDHYGAIIRYHEGKYLVQDPTFGRLYGRELWVSQAGIDEESDGYFLVPVGDFPQGWQPVTPEEASNVWGRGAPDHKDPDALTPCDTKKNCETDPKAMAVYNFHLMLVSLNISDIPLGYSPPVGPAIEFRATYNQRDSESRLLVNYSNLGDKWTFDWLSYISDSGSGGARSTVRRYASGGGFLTHTFSNGSYTRDLDGGVLAYLNDAAGERYELTFPDGSKQVFGRPSTSSPGLGSCFSLRSRTPPKILFKSITTPTLSTATGLIWSQMLSANKPTYIMTCLPPMSPCSPSVLRV